MVKFNKDDYKTWEAFRISKSDTILRAEYQMVCLLHSQYYNHAYYEPCTCNPKIINKWIKDLNIVWDNELK
jgi:hypothetical protein|tara:strand:+ start:56 stop:268 length:213 start_codon:yes stop_codon:yes gene_type:complete